MLCSHKATTPLHDQTEGGFGMTTDAPARRARPPSLFDALVAVLALIVLVSASFLLFGDEAAFGPNQVALTLAATLAAGIAWKNGHAWDDIRKAVVDGIASALPAIFILFAVGALIGTWAMSGTLVAMVYYALGILSPNYFYLSACIICALVATSIGSSWTVIATIGLGLMGVADQMNLSPFVTAGAVISGAYFGDKSSPLSDTLNLAAAAAGAQVFDHIRASFRTGAPALALALLGFALLGSPGDFDASATQAAIAARYEVSAWAFLPILVVVVLSVLRVSPFLAILAGALAGGVMAVLLQPELVLQHASRPDLPAWIGLLKGVWEALATGFVYQSGDPDLDVLLSRGGMESMLDTIWLIMSALAFGSVLQHAGMLDRIIAPAVRFARSTVSLVTTVVLSAIGMNVVAGDQYLAVVLPGRMFKPEFERRALPPALLSRTLGDSGTVTAPLVPWNSCGAYMAATLGVATLDFLPYCFFNLLNPLITIVAAFLVGRTVTPVARKSKEQKVVNPL
jgi:NhaC family Na+:H+ antiporter